MNLMDNIMIYFLLVSIDKVCKYLESLVYQEFAGAPLERVFDEYAIKQFRKVMEK